MVRSSCVVLGAYHERSVWIWNRITTFGKYLLMTKKSWMRGSKSFHISRGEKRYIFSCHLSSHVICHAYEHTATCVHTTVLVVAADFGRAAARVFQSKIDYLSVLRARGGMKSAAVTAASAWVCVVCTCVLDGHVCVLVRNIKLESNARQTSIN